MNRRQFVLGTGAAVSGFGLLVGSSAFSAADVDRDVTIDVVGDEDAFLRMAYGDLDLTDTRSPPPYEVELVEIGNQFGAPIEIDSFEIDTGGGITVIESTVPDSLEIGERRSVIVTVDCDESSRESRIFFDVKISGANVSAETTRSREVAVEIDRPTVDAVRFLGPRNVGVSTPLNEISIVYWTVEKAAERDDSNDETEQSDVRSRPPRGTIASVTRDEIPEFDPSKNLRLQSEEDATGIVAVYFPEFEQSFHHPKFDPVTGEIENWSSGDGVPVSGTIEFGVE